MLEKEIEKKVCAYAKECGCLVFKFVSPSHRSVPDRLFIAPGGRVFFIEFKAPGKKPTEAQILKIDTMLVQGAFVYVVDDIERGKGIIDLLC